MTALETWSIDELRTAAKGYADEALEIADANPAKSMESGLMAESLTKAITGLTYAVLALGGEVTDQED